MRRFPAWLDNAGVAALEFALLLPMLIAIFVGVADFGMAYHYQMQLSSVLDAGALYAFSKGQTESGSTLTTDVSSFLTSTSPVTLSSVSVTYNNGLDATSCYCVSGSPPTYTVATCASACADGSTAGKFIAISIGFTYTPIFAADRVFFSGPLIQSVTVRPQ